MRGKILSLESVPLLFDTATGARDDDARDREVRSDVYGDARRRRFSITRTILCSAIEYEISADTTDPAALKSFFEERDPALDRLAQDFAARLVAAVMENY